MKRVAAAALLAMALAGCMSISKVDGEQVVQGKLAVQVSAAWNRMRDPWDVQPFETWTQEGLPLDHLRIWGGVAPGQPLVSKPVEYLPREDQRAQRVPTFRSNMPPEKLVNLFEELYAASGTVQITRIEPTVFAGEKGVHFEFTLARREDDVMLQGAGWLAVRGGELYAATFVAPRMHFYPRLLPMAQAVVGTARIRAATGTASRAGSPPS
ncbi:hypothetical protein [Ramlibacter sp.]|uniref:hypothetical protein n=1 Tax=Ramlibacter sp. TaxID=1917967 RepID=UPI0017A0BBEE|nr:hypothetical protein [Ramlibacter sp.]MBA2674478.1 hypothetical protein [Ramlibacter sp.]